MRPIVGVVRGDEHARRLVEGNVARHLASAIGFCLYELDAGIPIRKRRDDGGHIVGAEIVDNQNLQILPGLIDQ